jgi:hypothetical protein
VSSLNNTLPALDAEPANTGAVKVAPELKVKFA